MSKSKPTCPFRQCPVGRLFSARDGSGLRSETGDPMARCALELLRAVRTVVDDWVKTLERRSRPGGRRRATKIKVQ